MRSPRKRGGWGLPIYIARRLDGDRLFAQLTVIERLNRNSTTVILQKGVEVNVLADGQLDLSRATLRKYVDDHPQRLRYNH